MFALQFAWLGQFGGVCSPIRISCILTLIHSDTRQIHVFPNDTRVSFVYAARMCVSFCIVGGWRCIHVLLIQFFARMTGFLAVEF